MPGETAGGKAGVSCSETVRFFSTTLPFLAGMRSSRCAPLSTSVGGFNRRRGGRGGVPGDWRRREIG